MTAACPATTTALLLQRAGAAMAPYCPIAPRFTSPLLESLAKHCRKKSVFVLSMDDAII